MRIRLARFLLWLGDFIQSLPVVVMRPNDLVEFSRQTYSHPDDVEQWTDDEIVDSGLSADEIQLLKDVPTKSGDLLLLGVGGGREAIPLAKMGFQVTGVDFVPALVERSIQNAAQRGFQIKGLVQEISQLDVPPESYDIVWLSRAMYSSVPTRKRRIEMVSRIARALKPGGYFLCQFHWNPRIRLSSRGKWVRRIISAITFGNTAYEDGDMLWGKIEFIHAFSSEDDIRSELEAGGLSVVRMDTGNQSYRGNAICRKIPVHKHEHGN